MSRDAAGVLVPAEPGPPTEAAGPGPAGRRVAVSDGEGRYVVDGLPAGDYSVSFTLSGFETLRRDGVSVAAPDGAALDAVLVFTSFAEDVTVVGSKLDTGRQEFGTSVAYLGAERLESDAIFTVEDAFDRTANAFTGTAQFGAAFGLGWRDPRGWFASGTFSYTDDAYTEIAAPVYTRVSSRRLLSGRAGYGRSGWSVYAWGANLLDDQYELARFDGRLFGLPGAYGRMADPRAVGAGIDFDW